ncbi:hypothetical protein EDD85DRAFT_863676 [Armillaria nabsnona]|nr:hypothetical protein EDD85DRAFT_863676 [Armillaria nabsnona]
MLMSLSHKSQSIYSGEIFVHQWVVIWLVAGKLMFLAIIFGRIRIGIDSGRHAWPHHKHPFTSWPTEMLTAKRLFLHEVAQRTKHCRLLTYLINGADSSANGSMVYIGDQQHCLAPTVLQTTTAGLLGRETTFDCSCQPAIVFVDLHLSGVS